MFKYKLDQLVWYLENNKVHSATILSRRYIDNLFPQKERCTEEQEELFGRFGNECILYATVHGEYSEDELFSTKEELLSKM
jgi:hypothetical protein